ncbi:MAG: type IV pilus secretin PilQ [Endomicrobiia bacterium]
MNTRNFIKKYIIFFIPIFTLSALLSQQDQQQSSPTATLEIVNPISGNQTSDIKPQEKPSLQQEVIKPQVAINELIDVVIEDNVVNLIFSFTPKLKKFFLDNPPRIVLDIEDCIFKLDKEEVVVEKENIKKVRARQFKTQPQKVTRVVLDLFQKQDYDVTLEKNKIKVFLKQSHQTTTQHPQQIKDEEKEVSLKQQKLPKENKKFVLPKTLITLECVDADIPEVLQMLAIKSKLNIIYGPDVTGKVSISLKNVPFDKAFENLLKITGLTYVSVSENIIRVASPQTIEQERSLDVVYTKIFPLNYASARDVAIQIDQIRQAEKRTKGMIIPDLRTNSLIVTETEEGLNYIEELIKKLDVKPYQVSIEAQVIDISLNNLSDLGVQWGGWGMEIQEGNQARFTTEKDVLGYTYKWEDIPGNSLQTGEAITSVFPTGVTPFLNFMFGKISLRSGFSAQAAIAALVAKGKAKVLSSPRVTTLNNKTAVILAGERIPYKTSRTETTTGAGGITTTQETWEYITAGIQLTVTPTVSPDGWITMDVKPKVDIPQISAIGAPPTVKSRETQVTVMLKNNESLVIGGLITDQDVETIRKVPLLGDLPILGYLFKYKGTTKQRTELIILLTPRIIEN